MSFLLSSLFTSTWILLTASPSLPALPLPPCSFPPSLPHHLSLPLSLSPYLPPPALHILLFLTPFHSPSPSIPLSPSLPLPLSPPSLPYAQDNIVVFDYKGLMRHIPGIRMMMLSLAEKCFPDMAVSALTND